MPNFSVGIDELKAGLNVVDLLAAKASVFPSKSEAKKTIQGGGVSINRVKVAADTEVVSTDRLINNKFLVAQKGKKNYFLIEAVL